VYATLLAHGVLHGGFATIVATACAMAREMAPAMLVLEDVDLVAENRALGRPTTVLFELLNQLDGLSEDTDVVFVLTTNRPEVIEPALASRPGRIDLAVSMPAPFTSCVKAPTSSPARCSEPSRLSDGQGLRVRAAQCRLRAHQSARVRAPPRTV
jgi:hypothetical protein